MSDLNAKTPILIDIPMPIKTDRLVIREPRFGDGAAMNEAKNETFDLLSKWMNWAKKKSTVEEDEIVAREAHINFLQKTDLTLYVFDRKTGDFIGGTGMHRFDWNTRIIEIGFWFRQSVQGKGYATESTKALIKYAFEELQANKVIIVHSKGNDASKRVIEKCGFEFEYVVKDEDELPDGTMSDAYWYSLYNADHLKDFNVSWNKKGLSPS